MAGHNKFSKIKHKKAASDAKKSKQFSMYARQIAFESKKAGGDTQSSGLRAAIDKARSINMPNDTIDRAVKKGLGADASTLEEVLYEAYGPGGSAIVVAGITDNKNRTTQEVKAILSKKNIELAQSGSALWAFDVKDGEYTAKDELTLAPSDKETLLGIIEALEENDDVKNVSTNAAFE